MSDWTPANLTTEPLAWFDASDASTITDAGGGAVSAWADKTTNGNDITATASRRPITGTQTLNSLNLLVFTEDRFDFAGDVSGVKCVMAVVDDVAGSDVSANITPLIGSRTPSSTSHIFLRPGDASYDVSLDGSDANSGNASMNGALSLTSGTNIDTGGQTDSGTTGPLLVYADVDTAIGIDALGAFATSNTYNADADFAEVVILDYVPSEADRQLIEGYLAHKWGQEGSLPAGHPYKASAPSTVVADATAETQTIPSGFVAPPTPKRLINTSGRSVSGNITAGLVMSVQPSAQDGSSYTYTPGGAVTINKDELDNNAHTNFPDGAVVDPAQAITSASVDDTDATGILVCEPDEWSGQVLAAGGSVHSEPIAFRHSGALYLCGIRSIDQRGVLMRNGKPWAVLPSIDAGDLARNDTQGFHSALVGVSFGGQIVVFQVHHTETLYAMVGSSASDFEGGTWTQVGPSRETTYIHAAAGTDGIWVLTRAENGQSSSSGGGSLLKVTVSGTTPALDQEDHLFKDSAQATDLRMYPSYIRRFVSGGVEYVGVIWAGRDGNRWTEQGGGVYNVTDNDWNNFAGADVGGASLGTPASPRFSTANMDADTHSGGGGLQLLSLNTETNGQRYRHAAYFEPASDFASSSECNVLLAFADWENSDVNAEDNDIDIRLAVWKDQGGTYSRYVTDIDGDALGLNAAVSYRLDGKIIESESGPPMLVITERNADTTVAAPGSAGSPNIYPNWGTRTTDGSGCKLLEYPMPGVFDVASDAAFETFVSGITPTERPFDTGQGYLGVFNVHGCPDVPGGYLVFMETAKLHDQQAQGIPVLNSVLGRALSQGYRSRNFRSRAGGVR